MVKDKIKFFEDKARETESVITYAKKPVSIADMRHGELDKTTATRFPFRMAVRKIDTDVMYKYMIYTLLQNNLSILSTQTIANVGAKITTHNEQFFKHHKAGALKLSTFFLEKQFPIKQRRDNTCMVDFVWHHCKNKRGFKTYTYKILSDEMSEYAVCFPMMSTQELVH